MRGLGNWFVTSLPELNDTAWHEREPGHAWRSQQFQKSECSTRKWVLA